MSDLYATVGRRPTASVNLITVHDGFTLSDLVSYDDQHNEANGENNHDGTSDNNSWNCGAEGPTTDPDVLALRSRQSRARAIAIYLDGSDDPDQAEDGAPLLDDDFLALVNSWWEPPRLRAARNAPGRAVAGRDRQLRPRRARRGSHTQRW